MHKARKIINCCMVALLAIHVGYAQTTTLSGTITDVAENPLEGVNIAVKNTNKGTISDVRGNFQLGGLTGNITLLISSVGYETQEVDIHLKDLLTKVEIRLDSETFSLEGVVILTNESLLENSVAEAKQRLENIPGGTNLSSMEKLQVQRSLTLKDALHFQPGVVIQEFFGANDQPRLNIRGSGIQSNPQRRGINLLQDGISTNFSDGSYIIGILEPRAANYIEVFRGANGLRYGATTLGGPLTLYRRMGIRFPHLNSGLRAVASAIMAGA